MSAGAAYHRWRDKRGQEGPAVRPADRIGFRTLSDWMQVAVRPAALATNSGSGLSGLPGVHPGDKPAGRKGAGWRQAIHGGTLAPGSLDRAGSYPQPCPSASVQRDRRSAAAEACCLLKSVRDLQDA